MTNWQKGSVIDPVDVLCLDTSTVVLVDTLSDTGEVVLTQVGSIHVLGGPLGLTSGPFIRVHNVTVREALRNTDRLSYISEP